jgi:predicted unusual protein kinase regulating ubiquinone biosynthesis (AarF/ABC1/UbiB family)
MIQITGDGPKIIFLDCGIVAEANNKHEALINVLLAMLKFDGRAAGRLMLVESNRQNDPGCALLSP